MQIALTPVGVIAALHGEVRRWLRSRRSRADLGRDRGGRPPPLRRCAAARGGGRTPKICPTSSSRATASPAMTAGTQRVALAGLRLRGHQWLFALPRLLTIW